MGARFSVLKRSLTVEAQWLQDSVGPGSAEKTGIVPKIETTGWTGLVIINVENVPAQVVLTAYNDRGAVIGVENITVDGHEKVQGTVQRLVSFDLNDATYMQFSSDREVIVMEITGSTDGMMLDALPSL